MIPVIETVVAAMVLFRAGSALEHFLSNISGEDYIVRSGLQLLYYITSDFKTGAHHIVHEVGLVPFVVEIMEEFATDANLNLYGCCLLQELSQHKELKEALLDAKVGHAVWKAFRKHSDLSGIKKAAYGTLDMLVSDD